MTRTPQQTRRRLFLIGSTALLVPALAIGAGAAMDHAGYRLMANLTPSVPEGIYLANRNTQALRRGELVAFKPHNAAAEFGFKMGWMKPGSSYIKRVSAIAGDMVCVDAELSVVTEEPGRPSTHRRLGPVAATDPKGTPLPHVLSGCQRVPAGHFFPVGDGVPNSFDGRYYGFVPITAIEERLSPIWTHDSTSKE